MADAQRLPVKHFVLHHAVTPLWDEKSKAQIAQWFSDNGFARAYGSNPANWSGLINPYTGQRSYSQAQVAGQRVTERTPDATPEERAAGYRVIELVQDIWGQICWHAGNWEINRASIGIENLGDYRNYALRDGDCQVIANFWRQHDRNMNGDTRVWGHQEVTLTSTACPSRIMESRNRIVELIDGGGGSPAPTPQPGNRKSNQEIANEVLAGKWGNNPQRRDSLIAAGYDYAAIQAIVNGNVGNPVAAPRKGNEVIADEVMAGAWGNNPERRTRLTAAGYDYLAIQNIINQRLGGGPAAPAAPARLSDSQVADQVIAGAWGNGPDRKTRLEGAGYNYAAVQAEVNRKLGIGGAPVPSRKSNDQIANEVLLGSWGNGPERKSRLAAAGYDYGAVQALVNRKLGL